jgi:hypothetical protein
MDAEPAQTFPHLHLEKARLTGFDIAMRSNSSIDVEVWHLSSTLIIVPKSALGARLKKS